MTDPTPTQTAPVATEPVTPPVPAAPAPKAPPWGSDENFKPAEAWELIQNLRKEKTPDTSALETKFAEMQASTEARNKALAEALGLTEPPKEADLTETVKGIQNQLAASQLEATRLRIAAEHKIPAEYQNLLTETDTEKLKAQAETVGALIAAQVAATASPEFQPNPGQGQNGAGGTSSDDEYAKYFPTPNRK